MLTASQGFDAEAHQMNEKPAVAPTLKDLAEATGLSIPAISKVLNNRKGVSAANRALVVRAAEEIGYRGRGRRPGIGRLDAAVVVTLEHYFTNDVFYGDILDVVLDQARTEGLNIDLGIVPGASAGTPAAYPIQDDGDQRGIILVGVDNPAVVEMVAASGRPAVLLNGMDRYMRVSSVSPDYNFGGWRATQHLLELGHRDILHVSHIHRESLRQRLLGFRGALEEAGIAFDPARHFLDLGAPDMLTMSCWEMVAANLSRRSTVPTGIVCANDMSALGVMQAVASLGLSVPGDVSVIGFDGLALAAHATPPLTTMEIDRSDMARTAVRLLIDQAREGTATARRLALGVNIVERDSTAPPRT
ncbi:hypothetical protein CJ014_25485 [Pleomorphomonas carboxyditropha]|uniref:HTH lacI-type domain-containing protein n=2 Tax=Pleomorphomonas carboxyditropha TaxID=2023338 RepID=A0A2G9WQI2_9HYPH|nr:hypothetical protein CJ014_25485 [Pleomorphomonas carboxyditropha]